MQDKLNRALNNWLRHHTTVSRKKTVIFENCLREKVICQQENKKIEMQVKYTFRCTIYGTEISLRNTPRKMRKSQYL